VGCGESTIAQFLALSGADITGIDVDLGSISFAETAAKAFGAPIHFIHAPVESLIQHTQKYDVILALDVLETVPDAPKLLWVMKQLLAPGGLIIISHITRSPKAWFMHVFLSSIIYRRTHRHSGDVRRFHTPRQLGKLCQKVGLTLTNVQGMRLSTSKHRWKLSPHVDTRYLATAS
jgi:2-polyprenyl-6-hydroxyphenyl methylase/3-demethylubiquinone-9 3-methyltransferase